MIPAGALAHTGCGSNQQQFHLRRIMSRNQRIVVGVVIWACVSAVLWFVLPKSKEAPDGRRDLRRDAGAARAARSGGEGTGDIAAGAAGAAAAGREGGNRAPPAEKVAAKRRSRQRLRSRRRRRRQRLQRSRRSSPRLPRRQPMPQCRELRSRSAVGRFRTSKQGTRRKSSSGRIGSLIDPRANIRSKSRSTASCWF